MRVFPFRPRYPRDGAYVSTRRSTEFLTVPPPPPGDPCCSSSPPHAPQEQRTRCGARILFEGYRPSPPDPSVPILSPPITCEYSSFFYIFQSSFDQLPRYHLKSSPVSSTKGSKKIVQNKSDYGPPSATGSRMVDPPPILLAVDPLIRFPMKNFFGLHVFLFLQATGTYYWVLQGCDAPDRFSA